MTALTLVVFLVVFVVLPHVVVDDVRGYLGRRGRTLQVKFISPLAKYPRRGTEESAGLDLALIHDATVAPHETLACRTGLALAVPDGHLGLVCSRSSTNRRGVSAWGWIDSDYRGEVYVVLRNETHTSVRFLSGDYVAQLIVVPYLRVAVEPVFDLPATARGEGGFGSTGGMAASPKYSRILTYQSVELTPDVLAASEARPDDTVHVSDLIDPRSRITPFAAIAGKWPGDETDEEIRIALEEMS